MVSLRSEKARERAMKDAKKRLKVKQEKFAQGVAQGLTPRRAYVEAGYNDSRGHGAEVNGHALLKQAHVAARVAEIREMAAGLGVALLTIVEKRIFLAEVILTPAGSVGPESRLCQEFYERVEMPGEGGGEKVVLRRRVRMVDKLRAIALDSKLAGHFSQAEEQAEPAAGPVTVDLEAIRKIAAQLWLRSPAGGALCKERGSPE